MTGTKALGPACLAVLLTGCVSVTYDVSPEGVTGTQAPQSTAGLVYGLAASSDYLYAITLNAGVWRSVDFNRWQPLTQSPALATSIAIDPAHPNHLIVGERNGDAKPIDLNHNGVWESFDRGDTWSFIWNPLHEAGCRTAANAAVPSVWIASNGDLYLATACGVYRRPANGVPTKFFTDGTTPTLGPILALASSRLPNGTERIWARTANAIVYTDNTALWTSTPIPALVQGFGTSGRSPGDDFALAAFGNTAVIPFVPDASSTTAVIASTECNPQQPGQNHRSTLLYFRTNTMDFVPQILPGSCDGTGTGGRRFVRSIVSNGTQSAPKLGTDVRVYVSAAQDLFEATGVNPDQTFQWKSYFTTGLHSDFWDVAVTPGGQLSLSNDGGVYDYRPVPNAVWTARHAGLHTHHIHTVTALSTGAEPRLVYSTADNGAWERDAAPFTSPTAGWKLSQPSGCEGDTHWTGGDAANFGIGVVIRHGGCAHVTNFVNVQMLVNPYCSPKLDSTGNPVCSDVEVVNPLRFAFIQTPASEAIALGLDVVALANLPLSIIQNGAIVPAPGPFGTGTGLALIRNKAWFNSPDTQAGWNDWELAAAAHPLPAGTFGIQVSGGHAAPRFFALTKTTGLRPAIQLWRLDRKGWVQIDVGAKILFSKARGPVFVNPFDPLHIFVLTDVDVRVSTDGGVKFLTDETLTKLVTASKKFGLSGDAGANGDGVVLASRANSLASISQIAFNRSRPHEVLVGAAFTGVFFASDDQRVWRRVGDSIDARRALVSSVQLDDSGGYVATEGRGLFRLGSPQYGVLATFFEQTPGAAGNSLARLMGSDGRPVAAAKVKVILLLPAGDEKSATMTTDASGSVPIPWRGALPTGTIAYLDFAGTKSLGRSETTFRY